MTTLAGSIGRRADDLFVEYQRDIHRQTDRLFAGLMGFQWLLGIAFSLWVAPLTWEGAESSTHPHVWAAVILGGIVSIFPALLGWFRPGETATRYIIAVAQMLMGALLIHLTGGRIETHFHVFGSLAFLAFYRDWKVLIPATIVVALDHMLRGMFWPQSVYGVLVASEWRWLEHAAWVAFEDLFLVVACLRSVAEMRQTAERTAALEHEVRTRQEAEQEARNANARNDAILDVALDCVVVVDAAGHIVQFNPAAEATFCYAAQEAIGRNVADLLVPAGKREAYHVALNHYLSADNAMLNRRVELIALRKGGTEFPVELAVAPISTVGVPLFAGYMRDITERKRAEEELARQNRDLHEAHDTERRNAEQLASLVKELRITQRQAETATRAKSEFLASMSHELRTPLNAIIMYSELLQEEAQDRHTAGSIPDLQRIQSSGKHLLDLINGILDLSKIEAGKMALELEHFDVKAMIDEVADTVGTLVQKNGNTFTVRCSADAGSMYGDLTKTRQILLNVLSNAAKFTSNGAVTVDVRRASNGGGPCVEFSVTDTGVGMTAEQSLRVFEPFTQADVTTTRKYGGTGLGLAIVSRFCELMGGTIALDSRPGEGSRFVVQLPVEMIDTSAGVYVPASLA
ncbi:MAG TPA: ATP-binding protein [Vicinamibacterales bacterium]|nr:ATP-binding protein [Vicinamibacterales bacterium]